MQKLGKFNLKNMEALPQETIDLIFNERVAELVKKDTEGTSTPEEKSELESYRLQAREHFRKLLLAQAKLGKLSKEDQAQLANIEELNSRAA